MDTIITGFDLLAIAQFNASIPPGENWSNSNIRAKTNRGQGPFPDRLTVICYCIGYMYRHYDDLRSILEQEQFIVRSNGLPILVLDLGCGPGTAGIALRDHIKSIGGFLPAIDYIGIDKSIEMTSMASQFISEMTSNGNKFAGIFFKSAIDALSNIRASPRKKYGHFIVVASYLFSQKALQDSDVRDIADLITWISTEYSHVIGSFMSTNIDTAKARSMPDKLPDLASLCMERGVGIPVASERYVPGRVRTPMLRRKDDFFYDPAKDDNAVCYALGDITRLDGDATSPFR